MRKIMIGITIAALAMLGASHARRGMKKLHDHCMAMFLGEETSARHDDDADLAFGTDDHECTC